MVCSKARSKKLERGGGRASKGRSLTIKEMNDREKNGWKSAEQNPRFHWSEEGSCRAYGILRAEHLEVGIKDGTLLFDVVTICAKQMCLLGKIEGTWLWVMAGGKHEGYGRPRAGEVGIIWLMEESRRLHLVLFEGLSAP